MLIHIGLGLSRGLSHCFNALLTIESKYHEAGRLPELRDLQNQRHYLPRIHTDIHG